LWDLSTTAAIDEHSVGVYVDGVLRSAVASDGSASVTTWIPGGSHEVCLAGVPLDAEPVLWGAESPTLTTGPDRWSAACAAVESQSPAPPRLLPHNRIVAHYGAGVTPNLGVLGEGTPDQALDRVVEAARAFEGLDERPVLPAFEYIVTVAQAGPGPSGNYTAAIDQAEVWPFLDLIRTVGGVLFIDFQPGRARFIDQVTRYEALLREPDVHIALDPEWSMGPGQVPNRHLGHTDPEAVGEVMDYLDALVKAHGLPPKVMILHQFKASMIERRDEILPYPTVALMIHVDGQGPVPTKYNTWDAIKADPPWYMGFKLFFDEDDRLMTPEEVMGLEPVPDYVSYQ
jgi:hypothetical protein